MSRLLISRSQDLKRLEDEGYDLEIREGYLLVKSIPYVTSSKEVKRGVLVSELTTAGDRTGPPGTHLLYFIGEHPCDKDGTQLVKIYHGGGQRLTPDLEVNHSFSSKPVGGQGYPNYYDKMTSYAAILSSQAQGLDPTVTARTYPPMTTTEDESVFMYLNSAVTRAGIGIPTSKLELPAVAIVGLGGTGSYLLDLVAKTPVKGIHLFDGDDLLTHNAFRAPGAASIEVLREMPKKVIYYRDLYSKLRRNIVAHEYDLTAENVNELRDMSFVFLCMDAGDSKVDVVAALESFGLNFIDVGMGVELVDDALHGTLRVTTSTVENREALRRRAPLGRAQENNEYEQNIQIADLNALNAALAVVKWKKLYGYYLDFRREKNSVYTVDTGALINDECE